MYEGVRQNLSVKGLIETKNEGKICKRGAGNYTNCAMCGVTQMCTLKVISHFGWTL